MALGARFHPFPFPDPVIVPMARNFDPIEQREGQHYFSDLLAESRRDPEHLDELDLRFSRMIAEQNAAADIINGSYGVPVDINSLEGRGHVRTWREDFELLQRQSTRLRAPAAYGSLGERLSGLSLVAFDSMNFPFRYSLSDLVDDAEIFDPVVPEFLTDRDRDAACHPLLRLAPGLVCTPWIADASVHALASPEGAGASWRFSEVLEFSAFTRHRGRLDGAARGAFSFDGGSSLAAVRLGRSWPLDRTGRWRMQGTLTLAADLPRGFGEKSASMLDAGPAILSDWSIGLAHASRDLHTRLSLSQPPRAETGRGALTLPIGRREDGTRTYETHRFSLVPSRRQLTLRLAHQRPLAGGDVLVSVHRTKNAGHSSTPSRFVTGIAWRRSF